jgi:hypothetical protein
MATESTQFWDKMSFFMERRAQRCVYNVNTTVLKNRFNFIILYQMYVFIYYIIYIIK